MELLKDLDIMGKETFAKLDIFMERWRNRRSSNIFKDNKFKNIIAA